MSVNPVYPLADLVKEYKAERDLLRLAVEDALSYLRTNYADEGGEFDDPGLFDVAETLANALSELPD
jgi:hypothetical protein